MSIGLIDSHFSNVSRTVVVAPYRRVGLHIGLFEPPQQDESNEPIKPRFKWLSPKRFKFFRSLKYLLPPPIPISVHSSASRAPTLHSPLHPRPYVDRAPRELSSAPLVGAFRRGSHEITAFYGFPSNIYSPTHTGIIPVL